MTHDANVYNQTMSDHDLNVITTNILRSRDRLPLNFAQMSTITGSLSSSAMITGAFPFHPFGAGANGSNSLSPTLSVGSNPTFNMGSLSVQGFTLGIIQPISPTYIQNKWRGSTSRELLLLLFVKELTLLDGDGNSIVYKNDPDNPAEMTAFRDVIFALTARLNLGIKVTTVLEPVGPSFPYFATQLACPTVPALPAATPTAPVPTSVTGTTCLPSSGPAQDVAGANRFDGLGQVTAQSDAQYHVGNFLDNDPVDAPVDLGDDPDPSQRGQLFRVYANQVALCADPDPKGEIQIYPAGGTHAGANSLFAAKLMGGGGNSSGGNAVQSSASGTPAGATKGGAGGSSGGASTSSQVTVALQADRISAIIATEDCKPDELVMDPATEKGYAANTATFSHVQWRSIAEVFQYLGALSRNSDVPQTQATWVDVPDPGVKRDDFGVSDDPANIFSVAESKGSCKDLYFTDEGELLKCFSESDNLFSMKRGINIDWLDSIQVLYEGRVAYIPAHTRGGHDHSFEVLTMLSELLNTAKNQADLPITPQLLIP